MRRGWYCRHARGDAWSVNIRRDFQLHRVCVKLQGSYFHLSLALYSSVSVQHVCEGKQRECYYLIFSYSTGSVVQLPWPYLTIYNKLESDMKLQRNTTLHFFFLVHSIPTLAAACFGSA